MIGFSAGAFLVIDVAVDPREAPLAFVAAIYGGETLGRPIPKDAPPLFTCIAQDDVLLYRVVEGLYSDWTDAGRSAELHIYRRGNHGFGMAKQGMPQTAGSINSAIGSPIWHSSSAGSLHFGNWSERYQQRKVRSLHIARFVESDIA